jgi:hypothetical protein
MREAADAGVREPAIIQATHRLCPPKTVYLRIHRSRQPACDASPRRGQLPDTRCRRPPRRPSRTPTRSRWPVLGQCPPESDLRPKIPDGPSVRHGFGRRGWRRRTGGDTDVEDRRIGRKRPLAQARRHNKRVPFNERFGPDEPELAGRHEGGMRGGAVKDFASQWARAVPPSIAPILHEKRSNHGWSMQQAAHPPDRRTKLHVDLASTQAPSLGASHLSRASSSISIRSSAIRPRARVRPVGTEIGSPVVVREHQHCAGDGTAFA